MRCQSCANEYDQPGALVFSPPTPDGVCMKFHVCSACWHGAFRVQLLNPYQAAEVARQRGAAGGVVEADAREEN